MTPDEHAAAAAVSPAVLSPFNDGTNHGFVFPLQDRESGAGWLVVGTPISANQQHPLVKAAGKLAVSLLGASFRLRAAIVRNEDAMRRATLDELLDEAAGAESPGAERARSLGASTSRTASASSRSRWVRCPRWRVSRQ